MYLICYYLAPPELLKNWVWWPCGHLRRLLQDRHWGEWCRGLQSTPLVRSKGSCHRLRPSGKCIQFSVRWLSDGFTDKEAALGGSLQKALPSSLLDCEASRSSRIMCYQLEKHREDRASFPIVLEKVLSLVWFGLVFSCLAHDSFLSHSQASDEHSTSLHFKQICDLRHETL